MTIRQYLAEQKTKRIAKLKELKAPQVIIDHEESGDGFSHIQGIEQYGDLEIEAEVVRNLLEGSDEDNFVSPIILFHCLDLKYVLMTTVLDDSKPYSREHMSYPCKVTLTRMNVSF